jgi:hypothetical protein
MKRIQGLFEWVKIFISIFRGRSLTTYGKAHVNFIYEKFKHEFLYDLKDLAAAEESIKKFVDQVEIKNLGNLIRIGPKKDAGYVALDLFQAPFLLSGGAGKNIDFEMFFALRGSRVSLFDPTIARLPISHANIEHFKYALEGENSNIFKKSVCLADCLKHYISSCGKSEGLYLKLDIEGSEWDLLESSLAELLEFDQIFIEFHDLFKLPDSNFRTTYSIVNQFLIDNFYFVSISANNWATFINFGKSFTPLIYECTLVNKKYSSRLDHKNEVVFMDLAYKNNPNRPHIYHKPFYLE